MHPGGSSSREVLHSGVLHSGGSASRGFGKTLPPNNMGYGQRAGGTHPTGMHCCSVQSLHQPGINSTFSIKL